MPTFTQHMKRCLTYLFIVLCNIASAQQYCLDSSIRLKYGYTNTNTLELFNVSDLSGFNLYVGKYIDFSSNTTGCIVQKNDWGENLIFAKRYFIPGTATILLGGVPAPGSSVIAMGVWGNSNSLLLTRISTDGSILWAKRIVAKTNHSGYGSGALFLKDVYVSGTNIYFIAQFSISGIRDVLVKLDLDGNVVWSKRFEKLGSSGYGSYFVTAPLFANGQILLVSQTNSSTQQFPTITRVDDLTGNLIDAYGFRSVADFFTIGLVPDKLRQNSDNTLSLIGTMTLTGASLSSPSGLPFKLTFDNNLNVVSAEYKYGTPINSQVQFDFNSLDEHSILKDQQSGNSKFLATFDKNFKILRSRQFILPPTGTFRSSINFDNKRNLHFNFNYRQNNISYLEYARISDFAAANTATCFGVDSSIFQDRQLTITRVPFSWEVQESDVVNVFPVTFTEAPQSVTTELICKQVSYCDSIKVRGQQSFCLSNDAFRFNTHLNPECLKNINWEIDTNYANIISFEADTAVNLQFKKKGSFYLKTLVNNCVVKDSILITITDGQASLNMNRDSLLCPGGSLTLSVNPNMKNYQWQDGSAGSTYTVNTPGYYSVSAVDSCDNRFFEGITVTEVDTVLNINDYQQICVMDTAVVNLPLYLRNVSWSPNNNVLLRGNQLLFFPMQTTTYLIQGQREPNCNLAKTVNIILKIEPCPQDVKIPNSFTPNDDGLNDKFKAIVKGRPMLFNLTVYDRGGQIIFKTTDPNAGWDGKIKGQKQNSGGYVYICNYQFYGKAPRMEKGFMMLIR